MEQYLKLKRIIQGNPFNEFLTQADVNEANSYARCEYECNINYFPLLRKLNIVVRP